LERMLIRLADVLEVERELLLTKARDIMTDSSGCVSWSDFRRVFEFQVRLSWRERVFLTFDDPSCSCLSFGMGLFIMTLIVLSCAALILESESQFKQEPEVSWEYCKNFTRGERPTSCEDAPHSLPLFRTLDTVCVCFFTLEYVVRLAMAHGVRRALFYNASTLCDIICDDEPPRSFPAMEDRPQKHQSALGKTCRFSFGFSNIIDLVAILPWYIGVVFGQVPPGLTVLRAVRLTRVFKLSAYNEVLMITEKVMKDSLEPLTVLCFYLGMGIVVSGSLLYFVEEGTWRPPDAKYPDGVYERVKFPFAVDASSLTGEYVKETSHFTSIPLACWWVVVTITTVGYGDMVPNTMWGQLFASVTMVSGLIVLAMPIGVIGSNFSNGLATFKREKQAVREEVDRERRQDHNEKTEKGGYDTAGEGYSSTREMKVLPTDCGNGPDWAGDRAAAEDVTDRLEADVEKESLEVPALHQEVLTALERLRGSREQSLSACKGAPATASKCGSSPQNYDANGGFFSSPKFGAPDRSGAGGAGYTADTMGSGARTPADADLSAGEPAPEPPDDFDAFGVFMPPSRTACGGGFGVAGADGNGARAKTSPRSSPGASPRDLPILTDRPNGPRLASPAAVLGGGLEVARGSPLSSPGKTPTTLQDGQQHTSLFSGGDKAGGGGSVQLPVSRDWRRVRGLVEGPLLTQLTDSVKAAVFAQMYAAALRERLSDPPRSGGYSSTLGFGAESDRAIGGGPCGSFGPPGAALSSRESDGLEAKMLLFESSAPY